MIKAGIILFLSYAAVVALMYFLQDSLLYFPQKELSQTPGDINLEYEEIIFKAKDGTEISGWFVGARDEKGVVLFCHGNAGNISHRLDSIKIFNNLNLSVMIFDYRGYGKSRGKPTEQGTYLDAEAAWDYLIRTKQKTPESITLFGRSLGGAVAAEIAFRKNPGRLIIESGFTSVTELAKKHYPWLPIKLISKFKYSTIEKIGSIKCPKLIIHSPADEIVPFEHGRTIYQKGSQPKEFLEIRGNHNEGFLISGKTYTEGLRKFLSY
jgi:hypothetical protein